MINKEYKRFEIICDNCFDGSEVENWEEALEYMEENKWKKKKVDGKFLHYCNQCKEE